MDNSQKDHTLEPFNILSSRAEARELRELLSMFAKIKDPSARSGILKEVNCAAQRT
jgi:hypothetical protein